MNLGELGQAGDVIGGSESGQSKGPLIYPAAQLDASSQLTRVRYPLDYSEELWKRSREKMFLLVFNKELHGIVSL